MNRACILLNIYAGLQPGAVNAFLISDASERQPKMSNIVFGKRLRYLRNRRGLTRYELCTPLNVNVPDLEAIENGAYLPGPKNMERLACFLGVAPMTLIRATEAEGPYVAARLTEFVEPFDENGRYEQRALLHVLMHMQDALLRLYRAVWRQKAYNPSALCDVLHAELTSRCESVCDILEKLAYPNIGESVQFPDDILESAEEAEQAGRKTGELAKTSWRPMLHRAQQWIVRELAAMGGCLLADEIQDNEIVLQVQRDVDILLVAINRIDCTNTHASILHLFGDEASRYIDQLNAASLS